MIVLTVTDEVPDFTNDPKRNNIVILYNPCLRCAVFICTSLQRGHSTVQGTRQHRSMRQRRCLAQGHFSKEKLLAQVLELISNRYSY